MLWLTDPMLALEHGVLAATILFCKVGVWFVWPVMTWCLAPSRRQGQR